MQQAEIEYIDAFMKSLHHLSEHTRKAYLRDIQSCCDYCVAHDVAKWSDLDGRQVRAYVTQKHRQGLGGRSLQRNLSALRVFYRFLIKIGAAKQNPAQGIVTPKTPKKLPERIVKCPES